MHIKSEEFYVPFSIKSRGFALPAQKVPKVISTSYSFTAAVESYYAKETEFVFLVRCKDENVV